MCTCVISSLSNATGMSMSSNSPAETCDTLLLMVIPVCCHFIYNLFLFQAYKIEVSRRSVTAILVDQVGFTKRTSYSLLYIYSKIAPVTQVRYFQAGSRDIHTSSLRHTYCREVTPLHVRVYRVIISVKFCIQQIPFVKR